MRLYKKQDLKYSFQFKSGEWVFKNFKNKQYTGPIITWNDKMSKSIRYFAGTVMNIETERLNELVANTGYGNLQYDELKIDYVPYLPEIEYYNWIVTDKDKEKGFIFRYFIESQSGNLSEVSKAKFEKFKDSKAVYKQALKMEKIKQYLDHSLIEANIIAINIAKKTIPNIQNVINPLDVLTAKVNQWTNGNIFVKEETNEYYTGFFHVMPGLGVFTGRYHTENQQALIPIDKEKATYIPPNLVP